jgi:DNA repair exonuclease SbcCD ATPase subunit
LFFDELFDGLDVSGRAACSGALAELAADRCVVLVTHDADLAERLPAVRRVHVADGRVS